MAPLPPSLVPPGFAEPQRGHGGLLGQESASGSVGPDHRCLRPDRIDAAAAAAGDQGESEQGSSRRKKKKKRDWWTDPEDAEWRAHPWVLNDPARSRTVKVKGDGDQWHVLEGAQTQQVLTFYDRAYVGSMLKNVGMPNGHVYDYRFEGGSTLTQWNPVHTDRRPREVQIVYAVLS